MTVICLGLSHLTAPIALRERAVFPLSALKGWWIRAAGPAGSGHRPPFHGLVGLLEAPAGSIEDEMPAPHAALAELAVLQTCNRTELYAAASDPEAAGRLLLAFLLETSGLEAADLEPHLYFHRDGLTVRHLMQVAAGLDSLITGEAQILGQVGVALEAARREGLAGSRLATLFEAAVRTGRRARAETLIGHGAGSISSAAVALARRASGSVAGQRIAVIGAGKMGLLAADALVRGGAAEVVVTNRSLARAQALAAELGGRAVPLEALTLTLAEADIVISATGAPSPVIGADAVAQAMSLRPSRPLIIVDIAVPRDVSAEVGAIAGVTLFNVDDLQQMVDQNLAERASATAKVREIVEEEAARLEASWLRLGTQPTLSALGRWADGVRRAELERALRRLGHLNDADHHVITALSEALVAKLLHMPMAKLQAPANGHDPEHYADALRALFDLSAAAEPVGHSPDLDEPKARPR